MDTTHETVHHWARERAAWKVRLADEITRYAIVTAVLVLLVRPIGVIVGLVWGLSIARRLYRGEVEPKLRRRWMKAELRRHRRACSRKAREGRGNWLDAHERGIAPPERDVDPSEHLARHMGDDPDRRRPYAWARTALAELDAVERDAERPGAAPGVVRMSDVVEDVVEPFEARDDGIDWRVDVAAEGRIEGDPERLRAVVRDLLVESADAVRGDAQGRPGVWIEMGENLAGSEVWVRVRDNRAEPADGARGYYGSRPVPGIPGATLETQCGADRGVDRILTLKKRTHGGNAA